MIDVLPSKPWMRVALCAALAACEADRATEPDASSTLEDARAPDCAATSAPTVLGRVDDARLAELSGLAASRLHPGLFYAHNDSGDGPHVYVIDASARVVATITLTGASSVDWEDIAVGPAADGAPSVFVGDVGDNAARDGSGAPRAEVRVHHFPEPSVPPSGAIELTATTTTLTYPGAPHDCEAIFVDPEGALFLLSKEDEGPSTLFRTPAPDATSRVLEEIATVTLAPGSASATAADLSPSGRSLLVRSYGALRLFTREGSEPWSDALARAPLRMRTQPELQSEAVAWLPDGRGYVTAPEGAMPALARVDLLDPACTY
ncbi:hypothetical protein [Sandaracinus amylolyticus]|nr:hypothetical protein [Sandaracinus amylolyticus]